jgi:hypothetical protein
MLNCGCENEITLEVDFTILCLGIWFILVIGAFLSFNYNIAIVFNIAWELGEYFNCWV